MKNVVIIPNPTKDKELKTTLMVIEKLHVLALNVYTERIYEKHLGSSVVYYDSFPAEMELIIVVGGDGSVIDASRFAVEYDIPILGINLGRVGYLTEVDPENIRLLDRLSSGEYTIEQKMLLTAELITDREYKKSERYAVNDVVISHNDFFGICDFTVENKKNDGVKYRADGVVISTPEGSTAYSLSAGGPIVSHDLDSILITPVCPHSFFNRSILFKSDEKITVTNIGDEALNISVDGRYFANMHRGDKCVVTKSNKRIKMLTFSEEDMFSTLFKKMRILEDVK